MQHYVLAGLARSGLFADAMFQGGTCLRILHGMERFSEDLDFLLKKPDPGFRWEPHLERVAADCAAEGIRFELQDRSQAGRPVRMAFLKTESIGKILELDLPFDRHNARKIRIKLEIDSNPPAGSGFETRYLAFPSTAAITVQTLSSGFGAKAHALLCRSYVKGRDWYDFAWYVARKVAPDLKLLANALEQAGPWAGKPIDVTPGWFLDTLERVIREVDWGKAVDDVRRFIPLRRQDALAHWGADFFLQQAESLGELLSH
jgi:predicted nucleotidyltransferase component of viral defense system